eukprot:365122-Chlamydomonas_euryale.AAC.15
MLSVAIGCCAAAAAAAATPLPSMHTAWGCGERHGRPPTSTAQHAAGGRRALHRSMQCAPPATRRSLAAVHQRCGGAPPGRQIAPGATGARAASLPGRCTHRGMGTGTVPKSPYKRKTRLLYS